MIIDQDKGEGKLGGVDGKVIKGAGVLGLQLMMLDIEDKLERIFIIVIFASTSIYKVGGDKNEI